MARYDIDSLDNRDPAAMRRFCDLIGPLLRWYFRPVISGLDRIPEGPGLYVGNHSGGMMPLDTFTLMVALFQRRGLAAMPYGLGHEIAIAAPVLRDIVVPFGAIRACHENAHRVFAQGDKALVYPGSDYDSFRSYWDRNRIVFGPRRGYIRLALRAGVPIIPVVTAGAHEICFVIDDGRWLLRRLPLLGKLTRAKAWPITLSIPWGLTIGPPLLYFPLRTRFYQEFLEPIRFERTGAMAAEDDLWVERCHQRVVIAMQAALDRLVAQRERDRHSSR